MKQIPRSPRYNRAKEIADLVLLHIEADQLPLDPLDILIKTGCLVFTYQEIAFLKGIPVSDICSTLGSEDGITVYNATKDKYAVSYNINRIKAERVRWTLAHELGHIALNHFIEFQQSRLIDGSLTNSELCILDQEADAFASELLAPNVVLRIKRCLDVDAIHNACRISRQAASIKSNFLNNISCYHINSTEARLMKQFRIC